VVSVVANPFKPTAGAVPPLLVGRRGVLEEFQESIEDGPGAPGLLQLFSGARGVGKTVMLNELGEVALANGWVVIHETATEGMMARIAGQVRQHRGELGSPDRKRLTGLTLPNWMGGGGAVWAGDADPEPGWRQEVSALLELLARQGTGLAITVDEIHGIGAEEMRQLSTQVQHLIREGRPVALLMAGLPKAVQDLLSGDVTTFLRRASRAALGDVDVEEVAESFRRIVAAGGRSITEDLAQRCAQATGGYPFMIQLVGYHVWRQGRTGPITAGHVEAGVDAARARVGNLVHAPALADLSDVDRSFLVHMAADDGPSRTSDIGARMGRDGNYANVYRARLIAAGMIRPAGQGLVDFEAPYMREYLRDHATHLIAHSRKR
jgi:hypothetical protein